MISRFYLKEHLSFDEISCDFTNGLVIFSGPSGAGKSVLMNSIQTLFGNQDSKAKLAEMIIEDHGITSDIFGLELDDDIIIKQTSSTKTRFFLNNQSISKKDLSNFTSNFSKHLHLKDTSDFESDKIIDFLDTLISKKDPTFENLLNDFQGQFKDLKSKIEQLEQINADEKNLDEIIEFTKFEIDKIASIDPKVDELNDLKDFKDKLSKKDKLDIYLQNAKPVLDDSHHITALLNNLDLDSSFFEDALNEVEIAIDKYNASFEFVDDDEIEKILTRIEDLTKLERKYGSIEEAISYKQEKEIELEKLDNITFEKAILEKNISKLEKIVNDLALQISKFRSSNISILEEKINHYLELLYLNNLQINLEPKTLSINGTDSIEFTLNSTALKSISSGEFNRLRLALLTARSEFEISHKGILFLDEIDANLSGKESAAIAKVLKQLSKHYQIFAISHQPQLSSCANQHFLVYKEDSISKVKELDHDGKVQEIARIISGDHITSEAKEFAQTLLEKNK